MPHELAEELPFIGANQEQLTMFVKRAATSQYVRPKTATDVLSGRTSGNEAALFVASIQAREHNDGSKKNALYTDLARYFVDFRELEPYSGKPHELQCYSSDALTDDVADYLALPPIVIRGALASTRLDFLSSTDKSYLTKFDQIAKKFLYQHGEGIQPGTVASRKWRRFTKSWDQKPDSFYRVFGSQCGSEERADIGKLTPYDTEYLWADYRARIKDKVQQLSPFDQETLELIEENAQKGQGHHRYVLHPDRTKAFFKRQVLPYNREMLVTHYKAIAFGDISHRMVSVPQEPGQELHFEG